MRKFLASLLLLATLLPFAAKADELTIHAGTTTNGFVPIYGYWADAYQKCEMVYPATDLVDILPSATINGIKFYASQTDVSWGLASFQVFVKEVDDATISAFNGTDGATIVYEGALSIVNKEMSITFSTPYTYNGGNLLIGLYEVTKGTYKASSWYGESATGASVQGYNGTNINNATPSQKNFLPKITFDYENPTVPPTTITSVGDVDLGDRPNNGWMPAMDFELYNIGTPGTITGIDANTPFVAAVATELPATIGYLGTVPATIGTTTTDATGATTGEVLVLFDENRNFSTFNVYANFYNATTPDIWEVAQEVTTFPYTATVPTTIRKNYDIPGASATAKDAVYKVTFDEDVVLNASATDGAVAIYAQDFNGEPGPMVDNVYTVPTGGSGGGSTPTGNWYYYDSGEYGTGVGLGASGGAFSWGCMWPAGTYTGNMVTKVSAYDKGYPMTGTVTIYNDGTTAPATAVGTMDIEFTGEPDDFVEFEFPTPVTIDPSKNLWVIFYNASGATYPAACSPDVTNDPNGRWIGLGENWYDMANVGVEGYTCMVRAYVQEGAKGEVHEISVPLNTNSSGVLSHCDVVTPRATNAPIENMLVPAGTYYLVFASDTDNFEVNIEISDIPAPEPAVVISPEDGAHNVTAPVTIEWVLGNFTKEIQVLFGTQLPPTDILIDWTDELVTSAVVNELQHNKTYFIQINARNASGETPSEVYGFTTVIDGVEDFAVANDKLYPGDVAEFSWTANRTLVGYNLYMDGELVNEEPITETEYVVDSLEYNMTGYSFQIASLYTEGESELSEPIVVRMTGNGSISGTVYEQDETTVIPGATVTVRGTDEHGANQTFTFTTDENGQYSGELLAGNYIAYGSKDGYQECPYNGEVVIEYNNETPNIDIIVYEYYAPLGMITATEQVEENNVLVEWDWTPAELIVDFETGDFSQAEFTLPATYPWAITTTNPYEGTYCMKSTCEGVASATSSIEATVEVPYDAKMGFYVRTSSESNFDKFHFYIDGVEQGSALSGNNPYAYKEYTVEPGTHTYKWEYTKDSSVNSNDDCIYVDNITMYRQDIPLPPVPGVTTYDFDDETMMGWTSIDADGDGNGWVSSANPGIYHNSGVNLAGTGHNASQAYVISGSYANQTGQALTPDNYLVSPTQISAVSGAQIQFWACAQDASYAAEHFGVAVSTTTATAGAFNTIQEWTMTAKGPQGTTAENARDIRGTRQGTWYQYTVDLSDYAGQDIWVAIRHFACTDMFILNVDDIVLSDGSAKGVGNNSNNRTAQHSNLYRRNNNEEDPTPELIAEPDLETFNYIDEEWANLPYGVYQWGIQACYEGNAPAKSRDELAYGFEGSFEGWTTIDADGDGYEWLLASESMSGYTAHAGSDMVFSQSYSAGTVLYPDNYLVCPTKGQYSQIHFYACAQDASYPQEKFGVAVSTGSNTNASDFTTVEFWTMSAKGSGKPAETTRSGNRVMGNWYEYTVDLSAYAGQDIWVALRHFDCHDWFYLDVDDITLTTGSGSTPVPPVPTPTFDGLSEIIWSNEIEKDMYSTVTVNVSLNNGQSTEGVTVALVGQETFNATLDASGTVTFESVRKGEYELTVSMEEFTEYNQTVDIDENEEVFNIVLNEIVGPVAGLYVSPTGWAKWNGGVPSGPTPPPVGPTNTWSDDFEDGALANWTLIDNGSPAGHGWGYTDVSALGWGSGESAHSGVGVASSWSWSNSAFQQNSYMISPLVEGATSVNYFVATNDEYPDYYEIMASSTGTNVSDFTVVFSETAPTGTKSGSGQKYAMGGNYSGNHRDFSPWTERTIELPAGTKYVAFHHQDYDENYLFIDDVTITMSGSKGVRSALSYKVMLDGVYEGETRNPYFQHDVEGFEEGSVHTTSVAAIYATGMGNWTDYVWTYTSCENFDGASNVAAAQNETNVTITWTMPDDPNPGPGPGPGPTPGQGQWYYYDDGINQNNIGAGGAFYWAIMFPAGSYTGDFVTKVATYDAGNSGYAFTGTATIYQGGTNAPGTSVGTVNVATTGATADFIEYEFATPVAIDDSQNLWVVFYNATSTSYCAAAFEETGAGNANARWVSLDGSSWMDLASAGISGYGWMLRVYVAEGAKGEVHEITVPTHACNNAGVLSEAPANRAMWDFVGYFEAAEGGHYGFATDGEYFYTSNWGYSSAAHNFYKYDLEGNVIEGFEIPGCGTLRGMTYDGEYFYGVANASTIYCVDLANHTLVSSTTSAYGAMRCITYDPVRDGFWVVGNWSGNLTLVDRTGAIVQAGPAPTSASDVAYYQDPDGVEHVYCFNNGDNGVYDYNITTNTLASAAVFDFDTNSAVTGSSGGCFVGPYQGKTCFFGDIQQSPNYIGIYELDENGTPGPGPGPGPGPTPGEFGILGAYVFRNGELISGIEPLTVTSFVDESAPAGENEYCVRVVYDGGLDTAYYAMSCPVCAEVEYECIPVNNLVAEYTYNSEEDYGVTLTWDCEFADEVLYYNVFYSDTIVTGITELEYYIEMTGNPGEYTFSVTAVYENCESEPVYVDVNVTSVNDLNGKVVLYPNPTNSNVTIEAAGMKHITVVNALGQVVYDVDLTADMTQLNLGQYKPGIYMVRINTEEGVSVKRVTVVK